MHLCAAKKVPFVNFAPNLAEVSIQKEEERLMHLTIKAFIQRRVLIAQEIGAHMILVAKTSTYAVRKELLASLLEKQVF